MVSNVMEAVGPALHQGLRRNTKEGKEVLWSDTSPRFAAPDRHCC